MTARVDMVAIDIDDDWDDIVRIIDDSSYSPPAGLLRRVDNIIGFFVPQPLFSRP